MYPNKRQIKDAIIVFVLIVNIAFLLINGYQLNNIYDTILIKSDKHVSNVSITKIKKERIQDAVVRATSILVDEGIDSIDSIKVSSFEYTYFVPDGDYYIEMIAVSPNLTFFGRKYDITSGNVFYQSIRNEDCECLLSLNQVFAVFSSIQKNLYIELFKDCDTSYTIEYNGRANMENILSNFPIVDGRIYILQDDIWCKMTSKQDILTDNYYLFNIYIDDIIQYVLIDSNELIK